MNIEDFKEIKNPYPAPKPVKDPSLFFGRAAEYAKIKKYLSEKKSIALIGERKIGKTSLFWYLERVLVNDGFVPIYIDLQSMMPRKNAIFLMTLSNKIKKGLLKLDKANIISADLQKNSLEIHMDESVYEFFLRNLDCYESCLKRLREKNKTVLVKSFVIMIDEIELLKEFNDGSLFSFLRPIIEQKDYFVFVVAGHDVLLNITKGESSPFFNMFKNIQLKGISEDGARKLIQDPVADYGVNHDKQSVERILKLTGGNPYFIQVICGEFLIQILNQDRRYNVTFDDVEKARSRFFELGNKVWLQTLNAMWIKANLNQQLILSIIAEHSGYCTKHDIDSYLDNAVDDLRGEINQNLQRLSELGLLYNEGERYFVPSELFQIWIKENNPTKFVLPKVAKITNSEKRRDNNKQITINITGENEVQIGKIGDGSGDQITLKNIKISKNDKENLEKTSRELIDFINELKEIYDQTKEIPGLCLRYEHILDQLKDLVTQSDLKDIDRPEKQSELKGRMSQILDTVDSQLTKTADHVEKYKETHGTLSHKIKKIADSKIIKETKKLVESVATSAVAGALLKALEVAICAV